MSLIEVLVALAIIAALVGAVSNIIGNTDRGKMKRESLRLVTTIKYLYNEATLRNQYFRIVFDLEDKKYFAESSEKPFYIIKPDDEAEALRKKNEEENKIDNGGTANPPPSFAEMESDNIEMVQLPEGIRFQDIYVQHDAEKKTEGKAYLYFFPRGLTEFAVIHIGEEDGEDVFALIVNPLTGAVEVRGEYVDYEELLDEMVEED